MLSMLCDRCGAEIGRNGRPTASARFILALVTEGKRLTRTEARILVILWDRRDRVVTRDTLMNLLYSDRSEPPYDSIINVRIHGLRRALRGTPLAIRTVYGGEGWQLVDSEEG